MAVTQLRCEPRAKKIYADARANGQHTKKEALRILKRHLSDVVHRRMVRDLASHPAQPLLTDHPARPPRSQGWPDGPSQASRLAAPP